MLLTVFRVGGAVGMAVVGAFVGETDGVVEGLFVGYDTSLAQRKIIFISE